MFKCVSKIMGLSFCIMVFLSSCSSKQIKNEELIVFFQQNKNDFDKLRQMYLADTNLRIIGTYKSGEEYVDLVDNKNTALSSERKAEYFQILKRLRIMGIGSWGKNEFQKDAIFFNMFRSGSALGGSIKRILWSSRPMSEEAVKKSGINVVNFTNIEDNWYLLCETNS